MEKTLYLAENQNLRVRSDGPSLWIEQERRAGRRVPARLVSRMIVVGNVALDTGALTLLARRGVPITLLDRKGEPVAIVLGTEDGAVQRRARQAALQEERESRRRIANWLDAWERGRQLRLLRQVDPSRSLLWRRTGFRRSDYEEWVLAASRARGQQLHARAFLRGALQELIAAEIIAAGWNPHAGARNGATPLGLVKEFALALQADVDAIWLSLALPERGNARACTRALAAQFESARPRLEALVRLMLEQYARMLWEF
ncbi:MAG TPA: CRISPR-associated endonuclease Cas1 [Candidatus Acidoferrales bacterium]|nr:CRISPR-associated endonuclease Cas1 [Candidatus Acidoferrales bacterium]